MIDTSALVTEIVTDLTSELSGEESFNSAVLTNKVKLAVREIIAKRNYRVTSWSDEKILDDLYNYYATISNVARYDYNQFGAEGESSHTENGVSRTYVTRDSLLKDVHAFVAVI